ncbi:hypothetical protein CF319_g1068 [Tilletia indica]|nr:hypothetical protein CF319_g1068 [Tilletia indica]
METIEDRRSTRSFSTAHGAERDLPTPSTENFPHTANAPGQSVPKRTNSDGDRQDSDPEKNAVHNQSGGDSPRQLYGFWAPEIANERKAYLIGIARLTALITILIWGVLAIYWGSLWKATEKTGELDAWIINRDTTGGIVGNTTISVLLDSKTNNEAMHLNWRVVSPADYPTSADVQHAVAVDEKAWIAVEVMQDVSNRLISARANGDASWSPQGQVMMYISEARANTVVPGYVLSPTQRRLQMAYASMANQLAGQYYTQIAGNATALSALARAPQTVSTPIIPTPDNLRPYNQPVATAPTFVGLIYVVIIALNVTLGNFGMRQPIQHKLKISSLIAMRFAIPIIVYLILSFNYSMLNLPFKLNFNGWGLGYGAGFMTFVAATWCGMIVLGLIIECAVSIVGPNFIGFFLILLIIANVSVVVFPIPLQPHFYRYGYALPFPHLKSIYTCLIFNTGRHILLLYHFGVLWGWMVVIALTFPIWIILERKRATPGSKK